MPWWISRGYNTAKCGGVEDQIGRPFALLDRPIVELRMGQPEPFGMHGMELAHQRVQRQRPVDLQLLLEQGLGPREVVDGHEGVVFLQVTDPLGVELPRHPVTTIETDLDLQREPGLEPHVHGAERRMHEIEVIVQALPRGRHEFEVLGGAIVIEDVGATGLDATEDGDQTGLLLWRRQLAHEVFLASLAGSQVMDATGGRGFGDSEGGLFDLATEVLGVLTEVFQEHAGRIEEAASPLANDKRHNCPAKRSRSNPLMVP